MVAFGRISAHMVWFWRLGTLLTSELILANIALHLGNSEMIWASFPGLPVNWGLYSGYLFLA